MVPKDYYLILGVSRSESPSGIRARYRDLVRTLHPDVAGAHSTSAFQEIAEAYEILADPAARRRHNAELARREGRPSFEPIEPLAERRRERTSPRAKSQAGWPFGSLVERRSWTFTRSGRSTAERLEGLTLEVILTPEEAARGVAVPIGVPGLHRCPDCGGTGHVWRFPCWSCGDQGVIATERIVRITIPPLIRSGLVIEGPLHALGIDNLYLRLHVRIE
jgi:DnaJ-class molecular chaperone